MSLITNKDNIYVIVPYGTGVEPITNFMEESFVIFVRGKINSTELPINEDSFMISRHGKHSGISVRKMENGDLNVAFSYWFASDDGEEKNIYKNTVFTLPNDLKTEYNDYVMQCDHERKKIFCYVNKNHVGTITYGGLIKEDYTKSFIWFGCGSMIVDLKYRGIGSFEFDEAFAISENVNIEKLYEIKDNHKNYTTLLSNGLPILSNDMELKDKMLFYLDFKNRSKYKLWNLVFNGIYPQFYIENNIYF